MSDLYGSVDEFRAHAYTRADDALLAPHLQDTYGIDVTGVERLDGAVFRVERRDSPPWVARVHPHRRPLAAAEGDAEILRFVERHAFPAERCIANPVSWLDGSAVVVTEFVPGHNARGAGDQALLRRLGELLGVLHSLPLESGATARPAGSWHTLSIEGGDRRHDVDALLSLLADARTRASAVDAEHFDQICKELDGLDTGDGLPVALTHPDFVSANVMRTPDGDVVLVDWTGAGCAPRVASLGFLLATTGGDPSRIQAVVDGYRSQVELSDEELTRLPDSVRAFPLVLDCWGIAYRDARPDAVASKIDAARAYATTVADQASRALTA